jgi:hypothetical protein
MQPAKDRIGMDDKRFAAAMARIGTWMVDIVLNGLIVRRGEALGVAAPANRLLRAIVKLIESK